jgi:DNA-directed RNA polymerase I, II, and III subunit RPABC2
MTSYFDEDNVSDENSFDDVSDSDSENSVDNKKNSNLNKSNLKKINNKIEDDLDLDLEIDDDFEEELEDDLNDEEEDQYGGAKDEEEDLNEEDDELLENEELNTKIKKVLPESILKISEDSDEDNDQEDEDGENYLKKFDKEINKNYIMNFHPECIMHNYDEVEALTKVVRDNKNIIIDDLHKTIPYLTKYERTRILGQRAKQINAGATAFVKVPENVIDGYLIAELELSEKRIPFIIRRPLPNGGSEYWNVKDLENISF